ncbi:nudix hydrolase homolog 9 [Actinidia rufa]|uniref:Nudix hydrolase homolog 9 n=1 Tax=Actinidia rufa TaxID=165716 RepID=A0A7J0FMC7_9ERIC|nr:nudix hydrolase homolog 9 [Actinidia rufa]
MDLINRNISREMFDSIIREVVEEIGVPAASLCDPVFIGISRRILNVRPAAFFFIKCSLQSNEIQQLYLGAQDGYESTQLYTVTMYYKFGNQLNLKCLSNRKSKVCMFDEIFHNRLRHDDLRIDCGSSLNQMNPQPETYLEWHTDKSFIKTGQNKLLPTNHTPTQLKTLRFFPKGQKNCYNLPLFTQYYKFLFRAGFCYANYNGLSKPPSFRLEIDGHFWASVTTSPSEYHELLYIIQEKQATVCLVWTNDDEVSFISSLGATAQLSDLYKFVDNKTTLFLHSRINYGANKRVE